MKTRNFTLSVLSVIFILLSTGSVLKAQSLWSTAFSGGINNAGTIVKLNTDGSGFTKVYDFTEATGSGPMGSLLQAANGKVYGTCVNGGVDSSCVVFCYDPITSTYTDIWDFDIYRGDFPMSGLIQGPDGMLYGAASAGGASYNGTSPGYGVLYSVDPTTNTYSDIYEFTGSAGYALCGSPMLANDGKLYGLTSGYMFFYDSTLAYGNIYSYDLATQTYTDLHDFNGIKDGYAFGSLIEHNGILYGMSSGNPQYDTSLMETVFNFNFQTLTAINQGNIFSYNISTGTYTDIHDFDMTNGSAPYGSLTMATDGKLYGTTSMGGANNLGVIFSLDPQNNTYTKLYDFDGIHGANPMTDLVQAADGNLYGSTSAGGSSSYGVAFSFNPANHNYTVQANFDYNNGRGPLSGGFTTVNAPTGILTPANNQSVTVFPVPAHNAITVNIESASTRNSVITITDLNGRNVWGNQSVAANSGTQVKLDISTLESGIYFLKVTSGENVVTRKIVRE